MSVHHQHRATGGWIAGVILAVGVHAVHADSQSMFDEMVDMYTNVTPGSSFETQRRGGVTLGSVVTRSKIVRPNLVNFTPPSIRGGCNGVDFFGGSFSFLNASQLEDAMRKIASQALNYAFFLALDGVCPVCMQKMEKLKEWANDLNMQMQDSCYYATKLVNGTGLRDWHDRRLAEAPNKEVQASEREDWFDALDQLISEKETDSRIGAFTSGNAVWKAMKKSNLASWYFNSVGDQDFMEIIMSVTGTFVKAPEDFSGATCVNTEGVEEYCYRQVPPLLDVEDLIDGTGTEPKEIWRCVDALECIKMTKETVADWPGIEERVREILFGPAPTYTGGLVFKLRDKAAVLEDREKAFIEAAPLPVLTILRNVAKYPGTLHTVAERLQRVISRQIARQLVYEMIEAVRTAIVHTDGIPMEPKMKQALKERIDQFKVKRDIEKMEQDEVVDLLNTSFQMWKYVSRQENSPFPAGTDKAAPKKQ